MGGTFGQRVAKHVFDNQTDLLEKSTYYILDAQGQQLSMYEHVMDTAQVNYYLTERNIYGSSRLGVARDTVNMYNPQLLPSYGILGNRNYELSNHLGNVLSIISDQIIALDEDFDDEVDGYEVSLANVADYSPFGVQLDGRTLNAESYRYGFNGMEKDDEAKGAGNSYTTEFRQYDPRIGRWLSIDPLFQNFPWQSPYVAFDNNPILLVDPYGLAAQNGNDGDPPKETENKETAPFLDPEKGGQLPEFTLIENSQVEYKIDVELQERKERMLNQAVSNLIGDNSPTAKEPVTNGNEKGGGINPLGPGLIASGQPWFPKRFVTPGSSPGTSLASKVLDKALPIKSPVRLPTPVINSSGVRMAYTKSVGRFASRWVPFIGWGLLMYDIYENREAIQESAKSVEETREKAIDLYGPGIFCFEKGTLIYAHTGLVPIEKIMLGDSVYSYNDSNNKVELNRVVNLFVRETESIYELKFGSEIVYVTGEHPFFVIDKGWTPVKELKEGNLLKTENDEVELSTITILNKTVMVYNIEVDKNHNYFVTKQKALVHNKNIIGNNQFNSINENYNSEDEYEE